MKVDLHIHSCYSRDSKMKLREILKTARAKGLDAVAITDHNSAEGGIRAKKLASEFGVDVIVGEEVLTDRGEVLCLFLNQEIESREFFEVVEIAKEQDALCIASHPFDPFRLNRLRGLDELYKYLHGIEVFNARCLLPSSNERALRFALNKGMVMTAGSDAHTYGEIGRAGVVCHELEDIRKGRVEIFGTPQGIVNLLIAKIYKTLGREA